MGSKKYPKVTKDGLVIAGLILGCVCAICVILPIAIPIAAGSSCYQIGKAYHARHSYLRTKKKKDLHPVSPELRRELTLVQSQPAKNTRFRLLKKRTKYPTDPGQAESLLLTLLPAELRLSIWEMVLEGQEVRVMEWSPHFRAPAQPQHWWAVVRTCRQVYVCPSLDTLQQTQGNARLIYCSYRETIGLLYSSTHFHLASTFVNFQVVPMFHSSILPQRWDCIKTLHFTWVFHEILRSRRHGCVVRTEHTGQVVGLDAWEVSCKILATLPALRDLCIHVYGFDMKSRLWSLRGVSASRSFTVWVPVKWPYCYEEQDMISEGVPFEIKRFRARSIQEEDDCCHILKREDKGIVT